MTEIISLGCGGGRHQTLDQTFRTGGFRIHTGIKLHVDPGPGALLLTKQLGLDPLELDGVFVSHSHSDHYVDAGILIEAMSREKADGGKFIGSESAVQGKGDLGPVISKYHRRKAGEIVVLEPMESLDCEGKELEATPTEHKDSTTIGLKVHTGSGIVGYTSDTQYFDELPEIFEGSRVLVANVTQPGGKRIEGHLCSDDLVKMLESIEPEVALILHMGMLFLRDSPKKEAASIQERTGVKTVPGYLGTKLKMEGKVRIEEGSLQTKIGKYF